MPRLQSNASGSCVLRVDQNAWLSFRAKFSPDNRRCSPIVPRRRHVTGKATFQVQIGDAGRVRFCEKSDAREPVNQRLVSRSDPNRANPLPSLTSSGRNHWIESEIPSCGGDCDSFPLFLSLSFEMRIDEFEWECKLAFTESIFFFSFQRLIDSSCETCLRSLKVCKV